MKKSESQLFKHPCEGWILRCPNFAEFNDIPDLSKPRATKNQNSCSHSVGNEKNIRKHTSSSSRSSNPLSKRPKKSPTNWKSRRAREHPSRRPCREALDRPSEPASEKRRQENLAKSLTQRSFGRADAEKLGEPRVLQPLELDPQMNADVLQIPELKSSFQGPKESPTDWKDSKSLEHLSRRPRQFRTGPP